MRVFSPPRRVIWALDPFQGGAEFHQCTRGMLSALSERLKATIEPVHILSPVELDVTIDAALPSLDEYRRSAERALADTVRSVGIPSALPPRVLVQNASSTAQSVDGLIGYAEESGADLIVLGSHCRHGMTRWLLGSFAETLLLRSPIPVITCGPRMTRTGGFGRIFHPTDFSENSEAVFRRVVALARGLGSELTIYHTVSRTVEPVFQSGVYLLGSSYMPIETPYAGEREEEMTRRHAEAWGRWAEHQGVRGEVIVEPLAVSLAHRIVQRATELGAGLIALEAQSGHVASILLGSVVRQVLRHADCPVWVLRSSIAERRAEAITRSA